MTTKSGRVILVTGASGSGKSTLSTMINDLHNSLIVKVSDEMRAYVHKEGYKGLSEFMEENGSNSCFNFTRDSVMDSIITAGTKDVIVDGVYDERLYKMIEARSGKRNVVLISVYADYDFRLMRIRRRSNIRSNSDAHLELLRRDSVKDDVSFSRLVGLADVTISNGRGYARLENEARKLVMRLSH